MRTGSSRLFFIDFSKAGIFSSISIAFIVDFSDSARDFGASVAPSTSAIVDAVGLVPDITSLSLTLSRKNYMSFKFSILTPVDLMKDSTAVIAAVALPIVGCDGAAKKFGGLGNNGLL